MIRRLLFGRRVLECQCGEQFTPDRDGELEYDLHYRTAHEREMIAAPVRGQDPLTGAWVPVVPLPWYVRARSRADW